MQKKIAIAVDGSLPAAQAVCYATTIAAVIKNLHSMGLDEISQPGPGK